MYESIQQMNLSTITLFDENLKVSLRTYVYHRSDSLDEIERELSMHRMNRSLKFDVTHMLYSKTTVQLCLNTIRYCSVFVSYPFDRFVLNDDG
jgi:hypothetical protein